MRRLSLGSSCLEKKEEKSIIPDSVLLTKRVFGYLKLLISSYWQRYSSQVTVVRAVLPLCVCASQCCVCACVLLCVSSS